ncbi:uncharacterized protein LOC134814157 [Bolinopsis microptera]|uniref:uncharacterized protein LOC134814157 n=1 Tax=Bolinopsis microptera TaxID=2820187 RepID=UPI00307A77B3
MLLVGAVSSTIAAIFSVIAMSMFFNPGAKIRFAVIISYLLLVLVILSVAVTLIRWFQLFINTGRLGKNKFSQKNKRKFRITFIVLGILCVILAIVSAIGIFMFATKLKTVSGKLGMGKEKEDTSVVLVETKAEEEEEVDSSWYNETCAKNETGTACQLCGQCPDEQACNVCQGSPIWCGTCECDPNMQGPLRCGWWRKRLAKEQESDKLETEQESSEGDSTESETEKKNPMQMLQEFVGEPEPDSQCYNVSYGLRGIRRTFCQLYELTDSWQCKNGTDIFFDMEETRRRIMCIGGVVGEGATKRFIVSGLLVVSIIGHLVSVASIWCTGQAEQASEKGEGYKLQSDEKECGDEVKEEGSGGNEDEEEEFKETDTLTEIKL